MNYSKEEKMLQVNKNEPNFFTETKKKIRKPKESNAWNEISSIRSDLREYILTDEQNSMCAYCEKKITSNPNKSNIDHFKTRNLYPELTLAYSNLFISCNNPTHCSSIKDNIGLTKEDYNNLISPLNSDDNFTYSVTGDVLPKNAKASYTINTFSLNHISLIEERKQIMQNFHYMKDFTSDELFEAFGSHKSLILYLKSFE